MALVDLYKAVADESRIRVLNVLRHGIFNVQELTYILNLSQPTVSHHLKILQSAGIIRSEKQGTWAYYTLNADSTDSAAQKLCGSLFEILSASQADGMETQIDADMALLTTVQDHRRDRAKLFFDSVAATWRKLRTEAQGGVSYVEEIAKLIPQSGTVLELGCGSGAFLEQILPRSGETIGVDYSQAMITAAREALGSKAAHVDLRLGYLEHLPVGDSSVDIAVSHMVLHHVANPMDALKDVFRTLRPGGSFIIVDLTKHTREEMRDHFADIWLGFDPKELGRWTKEVGFASADIEILGKAREVFLLKAVKPSIH